MTCTMALKIIRRGGGWGKKRRKKKKVSNVTQKTPGQEVVFFLPPQPPSEFGLSQTTTSSDDREKEAERPARSRTAKQLQRRILRSTKTRLKWENSSSENGQCSSGTQMSVWSGMQGKSRLSFPFSLRISHDEKVLDTGIRYTSLYIY